MLKNVFIYKFPTSWISVQQFQKSQVTIDGGNSTKEQKILVWKIVILINGKNYLAIRFDALIDLLFIYFLAYYDGLFLS